MADAIEKHYIAYYIAYEQVKVCEHEIKDLRKQGERAAGEVRIPPCSFEEIPLRLAAIQAAWVPFRAKMAFLQEKIEQLRHYANEQFDLCWGIKRERADDDAVQSSVSEKSSNDAMIPARYERVVVTRAGEIHAWDDNLPRLIWCHPPTDKDCYALLWDYVDREVWILKWAEDRWHFNQYDMFENTEKEVFTGVPMERALIVAAPACAVCQHRDALLIAPWQVCPGCMGRHSLQCIEHWVEQVRALALYREQWPLACVSCREEGVRVFYSTSYYEPDDYDYCPRCTQQGRCARCGRQGLTEECEGPCHWCGWHVDEDHLMPATTFVCLCSAEEEAEMPFAFFDDEDFA